MTTQQPSNSHLAKFPRPLDDNGRGLHFILDSRQPYVEKYAPYLAEMKIKWATVYGGDEAQCIRVAKYLKDKFGIFSNMRVYASGDKPKTPDFWEKFARLAVQNGVAPYIQIFNEPEDGREGFDSPEHFASLWGQRAEAVVRGGGFPGLQVLSEDFVACLSGVSQQVKDNMYFSLHNYGANHPPMYPYPSSTIELDDTAVLRFLLIAQWTEKYLGVIPPMLGGEGGWLFKNHDDKSMSEVNIENWINWHYEMYEWFRSGVLSNGSPLPDYLFSVNPWLLWAGNWYSDSWVDGLHSDPAHSDEGSSQSQFKSDLIARLKNDTPYIRKFGHEGNVNPPTDLSKNGYVVECNIPLEVWAGRDIVASVVMGNNGNTTWGSETTLVPYGENVLNWSSTKVLKTISPNESNRFVLNIDIPFVEGTYPFSAILKDANGIFGEVVNCSLYVKNEQALEDIDHRASWIKVKQGSDYKVKSVYFYDNKPSDYPESQNGIRIIVSVLDVNLRPLWKVPVYQIWPDDKAIHYTRNGLVEFDMSGDSSFNPQKGESGPYTIQVGDAVVSGFGLPLKQHVEYAVIAVKQQ